MPKKITALKNSIIVFSYLLVVWGFYRNLFQYPEYIEELLIKPVIWLLPVFYLLKKEGLGPKSLGVTINNLFPAIYSALLLGVVFTLEGLLVNYFKYDQINFSANVGENFLLFSLLISSVTAITEELTFRGYIFNRFWHGIGKEWTANFIVTVMWVLVHVPIAVFRWEMGIDQMAVYLLLTGLFSLGSGFLFARTRNIASSIVLHVMWEWPIILFR